MKGLVSVAVVVAVTAGCGGSSKPAAQFPRVVQLEVDTKSTGGKALVLSASTNRELTSKKGTLYALELRGIDADSGDASFDHPTYVHPDRCVGGRGCEWTVVPDKAATYEYEAFLLDYVHNNTAGESNPVRTKWTAPPRPESIKLLVNGKTPPSLPLNADHYSDFPAGPMQVEAKWTTDARGPGYYVKISDDFAVTARCSVGTSGRVPKKVPLKVGQGDSWVLQLMTAQGDKVAGGFKTCVKGVAKHKTA